MDESSISIIIPCYNHAASLNRTLHALAQQNYSAYEVIVVDDGSTDDPATVVQRFQAELPISFFRFDTNRGAPAARNEGVRHASGTFVLFLDADVSLVPGALSVYVDTLRLHPEADFVYPNFWWGTRLFRGRVFDVAALREQNFIHTSALIRRSAFPGFDESLKKFQDWDLWLAMAEKGSRGVWIDRDLYRVEPRREGGMSRWLPSIMHRIPWPILGYMPQEVHRYREAEGIIRKKHGI
jgi:glycosyltransferase involved in cell wall biosynthesis